MEKCKSNKKVKESVNLTKECVNLNKECVNLTKERVNQWQVTILTSQPRKTTFTSETAAEIHK